MDVSKPSRSKPSKATSKRPSEVSAAKASTSSPVSKPNAKTAAPINAKTKVDASADAREEVQLGKSNAKKRIGGEVGKTGKTSWKRVKLADELQFAEAGFFMLEELTYDPSEPFDLYGEVVKRIPLKPAELEEEPIVDTNDSDLDEIDDESGAKQSKRDEKKKSPAPIAPAAKEKTKKVEAKENAKSAPTNPNRHHAATKADETVTKKTEKQLKKQEEPKNAKAKAKLDEKEKKEEEVEKMDESDSEDVPELELADNSEEEELEEEEDDEEEASKFVASAKWKEFVPQAEMSEEVELPEWTRTYALHKRLLLALQDLGFTKPTEIQSAVIPAALGKRFDVIGASQTGSGKTLAFGLPIVQQILELDEKAHKLADIANRNASEKPEIVERDFSIKALIMSPTRELGLQIVSHLEKLLVHSKHIRVASLVGGLAMTKQMRMLEKRPDIIVATPGRLWELISSGKFEKATGGHSLSELKWLVFDEADKMVEFGKFAELQNILRTVYDSRRRKHAASQNSGTVLTSDDQLLRESKGITEASKSKKKGKNENPNSLKPLQTFVFSATISIGEDARKNLKKVQNAASKLKRKIEEEKRKAKMQQKRKELKGNRNGKDEDGDTRDEKMMEKLMDQIDFQREIEFLDLTNRSHVVAGLEEAKMCCLHDEKDFYLYYFLMKYGGKSIVFVNAISNIKRILPLMVLLRVPAFGMHANMEQHHRMKNLEKFKESTNGVLITTDVMSRGVDIPQVDHVLHYSIPTSAEIFVHRSGRTARAFSTGLSVHIVDPEDRRHYTSIMHTLGRSEEDVPDFPIDMSLYNACKRRVKLATELDKLTHEEQKKQADAQWLKARAADLDTDIPDDLLSDDEIASGGKNEARFKQKAAENMRKKAKYGQLKTQLRELLAQPIGVHEKLLAQQNKLRKHGAKTENSFEDKLASSSSLMALEDSASKLPFSQSGARSSYITKHLGATQILAPKSTSFQSPPPLTDEELLETNNAESMQIDHSTSSTDAITSPKASSAAFKDVVKTKGSKDASLSKYMIDKVKTQRRARMQAMGRQGSTQSGISGPLKK